MKILNILSTHSFSGAENVVCQICNIFKKDSNIEMAYCSPIGEIEDKLQQENILYFPIKKLTYKNLKKVIKEYNPDILQAHDIRASIFASKFKYIKKISFMHVNNPSMKKLSIRSAVSSFYLKKFDKIIWVSKSCLEDFYFKNKIKNKSLVLQNIISVENANNKAEISSNQQQFDVVYCGRLNDQKNPLRIVEVIKEAKQKMPKISVAIVGDGELKNQMIEAVNASGLENNFKFFGYVNNPLGIVKNSKIMIMSSIFEGTPMTALEALALGLPIITTATDGMKDIITDGYNGYKFDENSQASAYICELLENKEKYEQIVKNVIAFSKDYNNTEKYKQTLEEVYTSL